MSDLSHLAVDLTGCMNCNVVKVCQQLSFSEIQTELAN